MDKVSLLCDWDSELMHEFSRRAFQRFTGRSLLSIPLPFISTYMEANVKKEVEKDRLIIDHAAAIHASGKGLQDLDVEEVFEETKAVDKTFLQGLLIPSLSIHVRYEDIAAVRKKRIERLSRAVFDLLGGWQDASTLAETVKRTYSEQEFKGAVLDVLSLYNLETRLLGKTIKFLPPFNRALNQFAEALFEAMEQVAEEMTESCAKKIYGQEPVPCPSPI